MDETETNNVGIPQDVHPGHIIACDSRFIIDFQLVNRVGLIGLTRRGACHLRVDSEKKFSKTSKRVALFR